MASQHYLCLVHTHMQAQTTSSPPACPLKACKINLCNQCHVFTRRRRMRHSCTSQTPFPGFYATAASTYYLLFQPISPANSSIIPLCSTASSLLRISLIPTRWCPTTQVRIRRLSTRRSWAGSLCRVSIILRAVRPLQTRWQLALCGSGPSRRDRGRCVRRLWRCV